MARGRVRGNLCSPQLRGAVTAPVPSCPSLTRPLLPGQGGIFLEGSPWPREKLCFLSAGSNSVQRVQAESAPRGF